MMNTIFYMEDDESIAQNVQKYLSCHNFKVSVFSTVADLKKELEKRLPTMILVDWNMPDGRGDALCRWIRDRYSEMPIIFLTVRSDTQDIVRGFENGADDYVVKPFELEILYSRICALLRRVNDVSGQFLSCDNISVDQSRMQVFYNGEDVNLSPSEYQLLLLFIQNKGKILTRENILEQIWDLNENYVNDNTLTVTMKRLREKLHQPSCLKTIRSIGYRMEESQR